MNGSRIYWTTDEVCLVANRFFDLYCNDPFEPLLSLLAKAQEALPQSRRRNCKTVKAYGNEFIAELKSKKVEAKQRLQRKLLPQAPVAVEQPEPEPIIIPIAEEVPIDKKKIIDQMSTGELVGIVVDRMGPALGAFMAAALRQPTPAPVHHAPPMHHESNGNGVAVKPNLKRVTVVGLFPESERFVREKIGGFGNISVSFVDSNSKSVSNKIADHVILMRRIVSHTQREQAVALHGRNRITYVEGGQQELLKKLADLNSLKS